jgi:hypothetical protein
MRGRLVAVFGRRWTVFIGAPFIMGWSLASGFPVSVNAGLEPTRYPLFVAIGSSLDGSALFIAMTIGC